MNRYAKSVLTATVVTLSLTACSSAGGTSCNEYAAMDMNERISLERDLMSSKDLDPNDQGNVIGLRNALNNFCGTTGLRALRGEPEEASRNNSTPIEEAVDWDASYW